MIEIPKFQIVWWHKWQGFHFRRAMFGLALIYDWYIWLGFLEIRKWHNMKPGEIERYMTSSDTIRREMMPIYNRIKTILALFRKYGIRKILAAYQDSSDDSWHVLVDCPHCGTEHRIHKLRAARGMVRCRNCKTMFVVMDQTVEESAFIQVFGGR